MRRLTTKRSKVVTTSLSALCRGTFESKATRQLYLSCFDRIRGCELTLRASRAQVLLGQCKKSTWTRLLPYHRCDEAHQHLDSARHIQVSLKDGGMVAQVEKTRACVFLKQGRFAEAEQTARAAVYGHEKTAWFMPHAVLGSHFKP